MTTIQIALQSPLAPERLLEAANDFSARRAEVWPAVSVARLTVHDRGDTWADVTEETRAGPVVNWERCRYDWSQPGSVTATVIDSSVYAVPGSSWELKAEPSDSGSSVEMIWAREFRSGLRGWLFGHRVSDRGHASVRRLRARGAREPGATRARHHVVTQPLCHRRLPSIRSRTPDSSTVVRAPHTPVSGVRPARRRSHSCGPRGT